MNPISLLESYINQSIPYAWDDSESWFEFLAKIHAKVNELVSASNAYFAVDLVSYTESLLASWVEDGTMTTLLIPLIALKANQTDMLQGDVEGIEYTDSRKALLDAKIALKADKYDMLQGDAMGIAYINSKSAMLEEAIDALSSGSPSGVYTDLAALITADPDHNKTYITANDGKWNYYNGTAFVAGGIYQASVLDKTTILSTAGLPNPTPIITLQNSPGQTSFEVDTDADGLADWWMVFLEGNPSLETDAKAGTYSQQISYNNESGVAKWVGIRGHEYNNVIAAAHGDVLYVSIWAKKTANHTDENPFLLGIRVYNTLRDTLTSAANPEGLTNQWKRYSGLITISNEESAAACLNAYVNCSNGAMAEIMFDGAVIFNVTTAFGKGNEPKLSQIDDMLTLNYPSSGYFSDAVSIPFSSRGKVMSEVRGVVKMATPFELMENTRHEKWAHTTLGIVGDSISKYGTAHMQNPDNIYHARIHYELGLFNTFVEAWDGSAISREASYTNKRFTRRFFDLNVSCDVVAVFGGVNDFLQNANLGTFSDEPTNGDNVSFYGSLKFLIEGLITMYPDGRFFFITPLPVITGGSPLGAKNTLGKTLLDYVKAIREVCELYSIPVCDLHKTGEMYPYDATFRAKYIPDGTHPNGLGHKRIADKVMAFMDTL